MRNLSDVISNSKKKEFSVKVEIQLENNSMISELIVNETTTSFAKEKAEMILAENNIMKFNITSITEVEEEAPEVVVEEEEEMEAEEEGNDDEENEDEE